MSRAWSAFLCGTMVITIIAMFVLKVLKHRGGAPRPTLLLSVLVGAQVTSAVVGTSVGKLFSAAEGMWIWICVGVSIVSAAVNVISLMVRLPLRAHGFCYLAICGILTLTPVPDCVLPRASRLADGSFFRRTGHLRASADVCDAWCEHAHGPGHLGRLARSDTMVRVYRTLLYHGAWDM